MEAIWNKIHVERPPNCTWRTDIQKFDVTALKAMLKCSINDLESQEITRIEATILSRLIYRMKCKFRNDKGFKSIEKINRALLNYLSLALEKEYKNFQSYIEFDNKFITLPSKQMLEYVLVRTQGFAKLLARVEKVAKHAGIFLRTRIVLGHAWSVTLVAYAIISRIWILSRHLLRKSCIWYNGLYQFLNTFKIIGLPWLSRNNALPSNLKSWLALPWIDDNESSISDGTILKDNMFKLLQVQDNDLYEDIILDSKDESIDFGNIDFIPNTSKKSMSKETISSSVDESSPCLEDDLGEVVNRSNCTFKPCKRKREENEPTKKQKLLMNNDDENNIKRIANLEFTKQNQLESKGKKNKKKKEEELILSSTIVSKKNVSPELNMTESDLVILLHKDSYPGMDKLRWNIIRNKCNNLLKKSNKCPNKRKKIFIKKAINLIQGSI